MRDVREFLENVYPLTINLREGGGKGERERERERTLMPAGFLL